MARYKSSLATGLIALLPLAAIAQQTASEEAVQEIIVTAQKRETSVQDVPFSVGVQTADRSARAAPNNIVDLARNVAGLAIADLGPGQSQVAIRGISAGQVIRDQPGVKEQVGIYLDESPISVALFTPDLDLLRPRALRSAARSAGHAVRLGLDVGHAALHHGATASRRHGRLRRRSVSSSVTGGDIGRRRQGRASICRSARHAALRVVGYYDRLPGFIDALQPDGSMKKDVNDGDKTGGRVALLFAAKRESAHHAAHRLSEARDGRLSARRLCTTSSAIRHTDPAETRLRRRRSSSRSSARASTTSSRSRDLKVDYDFGARRPDLDQFVHRSQRPRCCAMPRQLTGSVTIDLGGTADGCAHDLAAVRPHESESLQPGVRLASNGRSQLRLARRRFYQDVDRHYGQSLPTPGTTRIMQRSVGDTAELRHSTRRPTRRSSRNLTYKLKQYAVVRRSDLSLQRPVARDRRAALLRLRGRPRAQLRRRVRRCRRRPAAFRAARTRTASRRAPFSPIKPSDNMQFNAQVSRGFRLGGINDPINVPLCSPRGPRRLRRPGQLEGREEHELRARREDAVRRSPRHVQCLGVPHRHQGSAGDDDCRHLLVAHRVQRAEGAQRRHRGRAVRAPERELGFRHFGHVHGCGAAQLGHFRVAVAIPSSWAVWRKATACRPRREFQGVASLGFTMPVMGDGKNLFANLTFQHVGSSFSQFENEVAQLRADRRGALVPRLDPAAAPDRPSPRFAFDTELPCLRPRQFPHRPARRPVGSGGLRQQPHGRAGAAGAGLRARPQRARGLSHESAANFRRHAQPLVLADILGARGCDPSRLLLLVRDCEPPRASGGRSMSRCWSPSPSAFCSAISFPKPARP